MTPRIFRSLSAVLILGFSAPSMSSLQAEEISGSAVFTFVVGSGTAVPSGLQAYSSGHGDISC